VIMTSKSVVRPVTLALSVTSVLACAVLGSAAEESSRWVHPLCRPLPVNGNGPFLELADKGLMIIDAQGMRVSKDDGKTWSEPQPVCEGLDGLREGREPCALASCPAKRAIPRIGWGLACRHRMCHDAVRMTMPL